MGQKLLIDATTGTILDVDGCFIVDADDLTESEATALDEGTSDTEIGEIAKRRGKSLLGMGRDTGWGDNAYRYTISYSPLSLKDEAQSLIEGGVFDEDEDEYTKLQWVLGATKDQLESISYWIMDNDLVWEGFKENFIEALNWVYKAEIETE